MDKAVIFDMDGVIVDNYRFHNEAWKIFCHRHDLQLSDAFRSKVFGGTNRDHMHAFFEKTLTDQELLAYETEKEQIYRDLYRPHIVPVSGLYQFLRQLKAAGIPVALATSSPAINVDFVLQQTKTISFFDVILTASDVAHGKPNPEIYLKTAEKLKIKPAKCIVFEDSIVGIQSANAAGMKVIGLATTHKASELKDVKLIIADFNHFTIDQIKNLD